MSDHISCTLLGRKLKYRPIEVATPDGLTIAAQDWGREGSGRDILMIHGFSQTHLSWLKQTTGPLADHDRLVTYDNRGHGTSAKPLDPLFYREPGRWADEVESVIRQTGLNRPVIVAWSYAGRIALDYLSEHGDGGISGLVMVGATSATGPDMTGPAALLMREMAAPDLATSIEATRQFARACFAAPPPPEELELMLACSAHTPSAVRAALLGRPAEYADTLGRLRVPTLVVHGSDDLIVLPAAGEHTARSVRGARHLVYEGVGHAPFWEAPERFDADLAAFVGELG